jgi:hypothetical protein
VESETASSVISSFEESMDVENAAISTIMEMSSEGASGLLREIEMTVNSAVRETSSEKAKSVPRSLEEFMDVRSATIVKPQSLVSPDDHDFRFQIPKKRSVTARTALRTTLKQDN